MIPLWGSAFGQTPTQEISFLWIPKNPAITRVWLEDQGKAWPFPYHQKGGYKRQGGGNPWETCLVRVSDPYCYLRTAHGCGFKLSRGIQTPAEDRCFIQQKWMWWLVNLNPAFWGVVVLDFCLSIYIDWQRISIHPFILSFPHENKKNMCSSISFRVDKHQILFYLSISLDIHMLFSKYLLSSP